ncbi:MAG TPA: class I SAM-dependent methyltransferase [Verrucomicrobiae bacterium]|nr:class I SAM-dependent methyltransferase [Verrucomicrobiae bacterium]
MNDKTDIQNIYDNPTFFESYKALRKNDRGFNNALEQPAICSLLENLTDKTILDIGCGFGDFCRYARAQGASVVMGIDPSENMLKEAKDQTHDDHIQYQCVPVETFQLEKDTCDVIVSSLAFHYVEDFNLLVSKMYLWLKLGGQLIFSVEHPICTANPKAILGEDENGQFHPVYNYRDEQLFKQHWFVEGVEKYHRTISNYVNTLLIHGFCIQKILEPMPTDEQITAQPHFAIHKIRPPLMIISARKNDT